MRKSERIRRVIYMYENEFNTMGQTMGQALADVMTKSMMPELSKILASKDAEHEKTMRTVKANYDARIQQLQEHYEDTKQALKRAENDKARLREDKEGLAAEIKDLQGKKQELFEIASKYKTAILQQKEQVKGKDAVIQQQCQEIENLRKEVEYWKNVKRVKVASPFKGETEATLKAKAENKKYNVGVMLRELRVMATEAYQGDGKIDIKELTRRTTMSSTSIREYVKTLNPNNFRGQGDYPLQKWLNEGCKFKNCK